MSGRTPSFIVVGLVIIMFLLGLFYMSCSSRNTELKLSLDQFEDRIRTLTLKNSEADKKFESLNSKKRELDEEKLNIQRQMEKKDSEVNDLNTKLNERLAEIQSLKSDKKALDEQIKELKTMGDTIASKNSLIERLQQQLNEQKQFGINEQSRLQKEIESLKNQPSQNQIQSGLDNRSDPQLPPQRFRPLLSENSTARSIGSLIQGSIDKMSNVSKEVKAQIIPAALEMKEKVLNVFGVGTNSSNNGTTTISQRDEQSNRSISARDSNIVPPPPLELNERGQQNRQGEPQENVQLAPQRGRMIENESLLKRNGQLSNNGNNEDLERDDEEQFDDERKENQPADVLPDPRAIRPRSRLSQNENYRVANRDRFERPRGNIRSQRNFDNAEEANAENNPRRAARSMVRRVE